MQPNPIREALRTLEAEGLVVCNRHKPVKVSTLEPDQIEKVFEVRILLKCHAASLAIRDIKETTLKIYVFLLNRFAVAVMEHKEILDAILQKDGNLACSATKSHLDKLTKSLTDFLKTKEICRGF